MCGQKTEACVNASVNLLGCAYMSIVPKNKKIPSCHFLLLLVAVLGYGDLKTYTYKYIFAYSALIYIYMYIYIFI